jgi:hypothetical protein
MAGGEGEKKTGGSLTRTARKKLLIEETPGDLPGVHGRIQEWPFRQRHDGEAGGNKPHALIEL